MRIVDRELEKNQKQRQNDAARRIAGEEPEDMELTIPAPPLQALNRTAGVFDESAKKMWSGINTAPSVFERGAVFRTGEDKTR